jgi:hypothetical protein
LTRTNYQSWNITADAGSGAAGPESGQLVNFRQFGKCFDYAGGIAGGGPNWAFPCKQSPSLPDREWSQVWNQVWNLPPSGVGPIHVVDTNGARRCLRVPGAHVRTYATTAETCPPEGAAVPPELIWWVRGSDAATYDARYRIEGTGMWAGQCLAPLPGVGSAVQADYIGLAPCSGDYLQKWNALPPVSTSGLSNVTER